MGWRVGGASDVGREGDMLGWGGVEHLRGEGGWNIQEGEEQWITTGMRMCCIVTGNGG